MKREHGMTGEQGEREAFNSIFNNFHLNICESHKYIVIPIKIINVQF